METGGKDAKQDRGSPMFLTGGWEFVAERLGDGSRAASAHGKEKPKSLCVAERRLTAPISLRNAMLPAVIQASLLDGGKRSRALRSHGRRSAPSLPPTGRPAGASIVLRELTGATAGPGRPFRLRPAWWTEPMRRGCGGCHYQGYRQSLRRVGPLAATR